MAVGARNGDEFYVPVFVVGETWRVLTEPRGYAVEPGTVATWLESLLLDARLLVPGPEYLPLCMEIARASRVQGANIFDCQIAAVCIERQVTEIWTFDRRFVVDPRLKAVDPLAV